MDGIASVGSSFGAPMMSAPTSMTTNASSLAIISTQDDEDDEKKTVLIASSQQQTYTATGSLAGALSSASTSGAALDVTA